MKNSRQKKSSRPRRRTRNTNNYYKPVLGKMNSQVTKVTLENIGQVTYATGVSGTTYINQFVGFNHFSALAQEYKYFEFESAQIEVFWDAPAGTDGVATFAFFPINSTIETASTTTPTSVKQLDGLPGSIEVQPGVKNKGPWFPTHIKQQFSCTSQSNNNAGTLYSFVYNKSSGPVIINIITRINLIFYGPQYNTATTLPFTFKVVATPILEEVSSDEEEVISIKSRSKKR